MRLKTRPWGPARSYGDGRDKLGFNLEIGSAASQGGLFQSNGSWAVTAP